MSLRSVFVFMAIAVAPIAVALAILFVNIGDPFADFVASITETDAKLFVLILAISLLAGGSSSRR